LGKYLKSVGWCIDAMKGASDRGLYIPHSKNRFTGYNFKSKALDADALKKYILYNFQNTEENVGACTFRNLD